MTDLLTPWYDPKVDGQPVRVGKYEREYEIPQIDYWNGRIWFYGDGTGRIAIWQERPWRGLTEPNEEKPNGKD